MKIRRCEFRFGGEPFQREVLGEIVLYELDGFFYNLTVVAFLLSACPKEGGLTAQKVNKLEEQGMNAKKIAASSLGAFGEVTSPL